MMTQATEAAKTITGHLDTWGIWERMVPEKLGQDAASQSSWDIHLRRYETAGRYVQGKQVLDIASGTGFGSKMLKQLGAAAVVGVDISDDAIAYAKAHYADAGVTFLQGDAEKFDWPEKFDVIATYETIEHVPNPDKLLARLRQLIAEDGHLFLSVPLGETRHLDPYHLHAFTQEEMFALMEQSGFELQAYRVEPWKMTLKDSQELRKTSPEGAASWKDLLFTRRGRQVMKDYLSKGCIGWDWLLVHATPRSRETPIARQQLATLE